MKTLKAVCFIGVLLISFSVTLLAIKNIEKFPFKNKPIPRFEIISSKRPFLPDGGQCFNVRDIETGEEYLAIMWISGGLDLIPLDKEVNDG